MNIKRLLIAIGAAFVFIFVSDFLIHGVWLDAEYKATASLWRLEPEMQARFHWMLIGQLLAAISFVYIWAKWIRPRDLGAGAYFGLWLGVAQGIWAIAYYVVAPLPGSLAAKWFLVGILQAVLLGVIIAAIYRTDADIAAPRVS